MTGVVIRAAVRTDAPVLQAMLVAHFAHHGEVPQRGVEALERFGFGPRAVFRSLIAETAGQAVGFALFYPDFSTLRGQPGVMLHDLFVAPEARGTGLGRQLLSRVMQEAADWEAAFLTLMVDRDNDLARGFYARLGFAERGNYDMLILEGAGLAALGAT